MLRLILVLIGAAAIHAAATSKKSNETIARSDMRIHGGSFQSETDLDAIKFIAEIFGTSNAALGNGIVYNKYFVVVPSSILAGYDTKKKDITVKARCLNPSTNCDNGQVRKAKDYTINSACVSATTPMIDCIAVIRVCPAFPTGYPYPGFVTDPAPMKLTTTEVNMYQYDMGILKKATKKIGELCECTDIAGWNADKHFCLAEDGNVYGHSIDLNGMIITSADNSKVVGFLVKAQPTGGGAGEVVLHLGHADYTGATKFYETNTNTAPYAY